MKFIATVLTTLFLAGAALADVNVADFGVDTKGTSTNQRKAFQAAIDHAFDTGERTVRVPAGSMTLDGIRLFAGIRLIGEDTALWVPQTNTRGSFVCLFTFHAHKDKDRDRRNFQWSHPTMDSPDTLIEGFRMYGDRHQHTGNYERHQREHNHAIAALARPGGGRLVITVKDCTAFDWTGNAIYFQTAVGNVENVTSHNVFRGLVSATANTRVSGRNLRSYGLHGGGGIDFEPEGGGPIHVSLSGGDMDGDFDIATLPKSEVLVSDFAVRGGPFSLVNRSSKFGFSNSQFVVTGEGMRSGEPDIRLRGTAGGSTSFSGVHFTGEAVSLNERDSANHVVTFTGCTLNDQPLKAADVRRNVYKATGRNTVMVDGVEDDVADVGTLRPQPLVHSQGLPDGGGEEDAEDFDSDSSAPEGVELEELRPGDPSDLLDSPEELEADNPGSAIPVHLFPEHDSDFYVTNGSGKHIPYFVDPLGNVFVRMNRPGPGLLHTIRFGQYRPGSLR